MTPTPAYARLLDFGAPSPPRTLPAFDTLHAASPAPEVAAPPANSAAEDAESAYQRGLAEGQQRAENEFAAERNVLLKQHGSDCSRRVERAATTLAERLDAQLTDIFLSVSASAAQALAPILRKRIRDTAIDALADRLSTVLKDKSGLTVRIDGPADILEFLGAHPALAGHTLELEPSEQIDVKITIDKLHLETQIAGWLAGIEDFR